MGSAHQPRRCTACGGRLARDNPGTECGRCRSEHRHEPVATPELPAVFWEDDALQAALASRHMGRVVRAYRHHLHHGRRPLSQDVVAAWAGITQSQISRLETGPPLHNLHRLVEWARLLCIPQRHLWFTLPDEDRDDGSDDAANDAGGQPARAGDEGPHDQAFLPRILDQLATAMLCPKDCERENVPDLNGLTATVHRAWQLRQRADYTALGRLLASLLCRVERHAADLDGDDHHDALRLAVHTYNAASSLLKKLGDTPLGLTAADRAVRVARSLDDPLLTAAAAYRLANVLLVANRLAETRQVALDAASAIEPGKLQTRRSLAMWGGLLLTAAVAAGRCGDEPGAWELLGEARTASRLLDPDHADLYAIFGPTNVAIHGVQVAVELGNGRAAVQRAKRVDSDRLPASLLERRSQLLIDVAHGHVLERCDHDAVVTLQRAEQTAPQEVRFSAEVHELVRTMLGRERKGAAPGLRELADRLGVAC